MYHFRCLDSSGGYLFHSPHRAGAIIETCVCLHNCAKAGKVKLLRDIKCKDSFRKIQDKIVQPDNLGRKDRVKFANLRKSFIKDNFPASQAAPAIPCAVPRGGPRQPPRAGPSQPPRPGTSQEPRRGPRGSSRARTTSDSLVGPCITQ